ncbi:hypothetical protein GALMADRAFT_234767 [Galerina marginata CBS 339.88]|uniref:Ubiquitin-like domain-containing protein n=1 Tax=Galerina marginata (strain CBS 339.88) TaxID=685588 RepID=A0A067TR91_GALM3|nr:hypothetical protein GALMADRAFT_234767 [Galerina marginata CBS 339.88]
MNATDANNQQSAPAARQAKPPPAGPAPPAPATAPPAPPSHTNNVNGHHPPAQNGKGKKRNDAPVDPATMYESLKSRIAALEEEEVLEEEEERRYAEEAQKSVKGLEENAIHSKYIELFAELKRMERDHAKEKQKLVKDKDAAKGQLTKANQTKTKMENLARELQKDNKRLREDGKRLAQSVEEAQEELMRMKSDFAKRADKVKQQDVKYREMPDIVVKVVCRYRAELFFKISRKTKLSRLINSWTERMERTGGKAGDGKEGTMNGSAKTDAASTHYSGTTGSNSGLQFIFTFNGRMLEADQTPEEIGIDEGDEILAVELMDLTEGGGGSEEWEDHVEPRRERLKKYWTDDPQEARRTVEEMFDGVIRERLKEVLRQYELRERHFECVIRSKELEVLLSRARAAEQKQLAEGEKARSSKQEEENRQLRKDLEDAQNGQTMLIDKLITCCKEIIQKPNAERTQRLFASLREELERKGPRTAKKPADGPVGG